MKIHCLNVAGCFLGIKYQGHLRNEILHHCMAKILWFIFTILTASVPVFNFTIMSLLFLCMMVQVLIKIVLQAYIKSDGMSCIFLQSLSALLFVDVSFTPRQLIKFFSQLFLFSIKHRGYISL